MLLFNHRPLCQALFVTATLWTIPAPACNVPVFRYALERWEADPYEIAVFYDAPLTPEQQVPLETMEKAVQDRLANLAVSRFNLAGELSPPLRMLWKAQESATSPWIVVRYPRHAGIGRSAWAGPLSAESVGSLLESPARRTISQKLLSGDAVVWLLLESGDKVRDDDTGQLLEAELRKLEHTLVLPKPSTADPPTNPDLPLKIAFSTVRVARSNPTERMLVNLLLNWNTNLTTATEAMLFPIFGRGRVVPPAIGKEIRPEAIREMAEFLTGPCSCEVKEMNPGYDLLLTANWNTLAGYQEVMLPELPPLVGISQFAAKATNNTSTPSGQPAISLAATRAAPAPAGTGHLARNLAVVLGIGVIFLAATTLVLKARISRKPR